MKSAPKNTLSTSGMRNSASAKGERPAESRSGKSATAPAPMTSRPGMNFKVAGLGVDSVWINMVHNLTWPGFFGRVPKYPVHGPTARRDQGRLAGLKNPKRCRSFPNRHSAWVRGLWDHRSLREAAFLGVLLPGG